MASGWRGRLTNLYWERLLGSRQVSAFAERRLVEHVRALARDPTRVSSIPNAGIEEFVRRFLQLEYPGRMRTMRTLALDLGTSGQEVYDAVNKWTADTDQPLEIIKASVAPAYNRLLQRLVNVERGMEATVQMRADLLAAKDEEPALGELLMELSGLLRDWFSVGLLKLTQLSMMSPALHLTKIMSYSMRVSPKPIRSWSEMQARLEPGRRIYAFFHPALVDEPLVYVEVALCNNGTVPESFPALERAAAAQGGAVVAVFNAIASTQDGLRGLTLGEFLIKRVVDELSRSTEVGPSRFVTLSPIPGFVRYLQAKLRGGDLPQVPESFADLVINMDDKGLTPQRRQILEEHRSLIVELCARYLLREKHKGARALDPVANFHLRNGALVLRLNWMADEDPMRIRESVGLCVNYEYVKSMLEENHRMYTLHGEISADSSVLALLNEEQPEQPEARVTDVLPMRNNL